MFTKRNNKLVSVIRSTKAKAAAIGTTAMVAAGSAMASGGGGGVDFSDISAGFEEYKVAVIGLILAFAAVLWAMRGAGLAKRGG